VKGRLTKKIRRLVIDKSAVSVVISNVLLTAAVMALGSAVLFWTYQRALLANSEYSEVMDANVAKMREKLAFEYIFYNISSNELTVYLINCGKSDNLSLASVYLSNSSWFRSFYDITLRFVDGTLTQGLDISDEGYFRLSVSLVEYTSYSIRIITGRGRLFEATFIA
jgi:FlaG/FlaF family flagellin (archaellin)